MNVLKNLSILTSLILIQGILATVGAYFIFSANFSADRANVRSEAVIFAGHARQTTLAAEIFLRQIADDVLQDPRLFEEFDDEFADKWALEANRLPQVRSVNLVNSEGILINDAVVRGTRIVDLSDREYFIRTKAGERSVIITEPIFSRARDSWFFGMALGVFDERGNHIGVVILGIEPRYFLNFFSSIGDSRLNVALLSQEDTIAAARFVDDLTPPLGELLDDLPDFGRTEFSVPSLLGYGLVSYLPVEDWPLKVVVHQPFFLGLQKIIPPITVFLITIVVATSAALAILFRIQRSEKRLEVERNELSTIKRALEEQVSTDPLTGIRNRRGFMMDCQREISRCRRYKRPVSVIVMDIDHFKQINDEHGHQSGDEALRVFSEVCQSSTRETDVLGRLGGEEFGLLLPETGHTDGLMLANRIRNRVAEQPIWSPDGDDGGPFKMTVSMGLADVDPEGNLEEALSQADKALYQAKAAGRNKVIFAET